MQGRRDERRAPSAMHMRSEGTDRQTSETGPSTDVTRNMWFREPPRTTQEGATLVPN